MSDFKTLYEDMKKKAGYGTDSSSTKGGGSGSDFMSLYNQMKNAAGSGYVAPTTKYEPIDPSSGSFVSKTVYDTDTDYGRWKSTEDWATRYNAAINGIADYQQGINGGFSTDYSGGYLDEIDALLADYENIRGYADQSGLRNSSTYYDALQELKKSLTERNGFMSQFDSADEYSQYLADQEEQQKILTERLGYDTTAGQQKIDALNEDFLKFEEINPFYQQYVQNGGDPDEISDTLPWASEYKRLASEYGSFEDLKRAITAEEVMYNQSKRAQKAQELAGVSIEGSANYDPQFAQKSAYESTELDNAWQKMWSEYGLGYDDLTYEFINDKDGIVREQVLNSAKKGNGEDYEKWKTLAKLDPEEIAIYNYHYANNGKKVADEFIDSISESLSARRAEDRFAEMQGKTGRELAFAVQAGLDQFGTGLQNIFSDADYIPVNSTQYTSQMVREDLADDRLFKNSKAKTSFGQGVYDTITTTANMVPSILASVAIGAVSKTAGSAATAKLLGTVGQAVGSGLMGASAAGNAYQEKLNAGYSKDDARAYGVMVGASEIVMEKALGGITALGGGALGKAGLNKLAQIDDVLARFAETAGGKILANAGSEALEEAVQSIVEPYIWQAISGEEMAVDWQEVLYSGLLGFATGGFFESVTTGAEAAKQSYAETRTGKSVINTKDGLANLNAAAASLSSVASPEAQKQIAKAQEKASTNKARAVGQLYNTVSAEVTKADTADIVSALNDQGIKGDVASKYADAIVARLSGTELTDYGKNIFDTAMRDKRVQTVVSDLIDNKMSTVGQRNQKLAAATGKEASTIDVAKVKEQHIKEFIEKNLEYQVSDDGRTIDTKTGKEVKVVDVKNIGKDGVVELNLEDGNVADAASLSFGNEVTAMAYSALKGKPMSAANANALVKLSDGMDIQEFAKQVELGYERGYANLSKPEGKVAEAAYEAGAAQRSTEGGKGKVSTSKKGITVLRKDGSKVDYESVKGEMNLSNKQIAAAKTIEFLRKMDLGTTFTLVESYTKFVKGKKRSFFVDENGIEQLAPNGRYYKDGRIYIDLNAGASRNGDVMLYTVAHELTHHIQQWNAAKYKVLADFLAEEYGKKGLDAYKQIKVKQQELSDARGKSVSFNEAYHEFVADSLSSMFVDGNVYDKLAKLHQKDADLFNELKSFIDNFLSRVKAWFHGTLGETRQAKFVQLNLSTDAIEYLQQQMAEALVEAGQNYKAAANGDYTGADMTNERAFEDSSVAVQNQIRPPYSDGSKAFNTFVDGLAADARKTFDLFYGFYQKSRITNTLSVTGRRVKGVNISSLYLLAQDWNDMLKREPKWAAAAKELADFLPDDVRKRMNMNEDGSLNPTLLEKEFKMPSSMAQRLVDALPVENIDGTYRLGGKEITLPEGKARQSVGGEAYRRAIIAETRKLFADGKLKPVSIGTMSKDRWGSLGFLAANGKTGASGDFTTVCPQMMFNRGCWYCYRRAAMEKGVNNKLVAQSVWYTGEILRIKQSDIDALNKNGGLRIQSFGDWMPHFSAMLADVLYDAEQRGLQVKIITKEPSMINYIAALREQGIGKNLYFNLSADYTIEKGPAKQNLANGSLDTINPERPFMRNDSGIWWKRAMTVEEASKYRDKYPWVNTRIVATTLDEFIRGLKDNRVDVVTGYHGNIREYERVDSTTGQHKVNVEALGDAGMPRFAFNPATGQWFTEYEGKTSTHKRLAEAIAQNGLQMEYYTKTCCITGRCATCAGKCGKLAKDFNIKNATNRDAESVAYWQKEMQYGIEPEFGDMTDVQYADRYWHPKMSNTEFAEVEGIAKQEATTTNNYLGIDVKWLYNTQNGHRYFALYSTARKDSPVMYACKGDRADYEYQILTNVVNEGGYLYESTNGSARPSARILNRIGSFTNQKTQHHNRPLGTGGNNGNAPTHSRNRRMRPSAAFKNCIKNIEQVQQRYSLDDHHQFAVDIGNYSVAQTMVNDAARSAMGDKLAPGVENTIYIKDGHTKDGKVVDFANAILDGKKKGETRTHKNLTRKWVGIAKDGMVIGRVKLGDPIVLRKGTEEYRNSLIEGTEYDIEDGQTKYYYPVEKIMDLRNNPRPIIRNGNYGQYQFKSIAPATYDADGNLIPLSERFNLESDDFYRSDRIEEEPAPSTDIIDDLRQRGEKAIETATAQREAKVAAEQKTHRAIRAALTNRDLIAQIEGKTDLEKRKLQEYNDALARSREFAATVTDLNRQIKEAEESNDPKKAETVKKLTFDLNKAKANKKTMESKLSRMENKELEPLVARERVRIIEELRKEYGTIPAGENPVRDDSLPTSTDGENFVSRTARTVKGAGATPDDFADLIDTEVAKGGLTYIRITNDEATQRAVEKITKNGWEQARAEWSAAIKAGKASAEMSAMGALLLNNAANAGDKKAWLDILHDYQQMGTNAAQAVQAMRILKSLAPSDKLYMAEKSLDALVDNLKAKGKVKLSEELKRKYINAKTDAERDAIMGEIQQDIANQIPPTPKDKWTALRYLNMLGNLRTQVRNLAGNTSMGLTVRLKDLIATGIEQLAYIATKGKFERTKALLPGKELRKAASADYDFVADIIATGGKFNDANNANSAFIRGVMEKRKIFKRKLFAGLEAYRKGTNWAMDKGDVLFSRAAYASALAGYLKAHGVTETDFSKVNETLLEKARLYAVQEAQEATFHDINAVSEFVTRRYRGENKAGKALSVALDGIMPFRKTPANIVVRAWEYSPLGITNALVMSAKAFTKDSDVTGAQIVNTWSKALTGSGLFVAGLLLASSGHLIGGPDDDDAEDKFQQLNGEQNYALKIGNKYITIDWASPSAIPLFMGAQLYQLAQENGFQLRDLEAALTSIADPLVEMSMLQGINDTIDNIKYSDNKLMQLAINAVVGYFTQGLTNTMLGQIERSFEKSRSTTYVDKNKDLPDWLQRTLGKVSAKVPGLWDYNQIAYINAWGEEEENPGILRSLVYNMLSPSYITEDKTDAVSTELVRLDDVNASGRGVFPSTPRKTATFTDKDGVQHKDYQLNAEEYVALAKKHGQTQRQIIERMIDNEMYKNLPDEYKIKAVQAAYDYARENAQIEVLGRDGYESKWMGEIKGDVAKGILDHIYSQNAKDLYLSGEFSYGDASAVLANQRGKSKSETATAMSKWECEKDTGIAYDDLKNAYINGEISASEAASYKVKYGGMRADEAQEAVDEWRCEKETGIAYTDIKRAYLDGEITAGKAASMKVKYGDFDEDEAAETVAYWDFQADYPDYDDLSQNYAFAYLEEGKSAGIKIGTYYDCVKALGKCEGEKDEETGKTKSGSVREEMNNVINSYNLSREQKYIIYYASGGSEKKAKQVPWY